MFYIDNLLIKGFRNYRQQQLQFHPHLNILIGDNAQGKTNLLESIYYLSVTRSFRTNHDQELAHWDERSLYLKGTFIKNGFNHVVQISYLQNGHFKLTINNDPVNRYDHLQQFPVVVFSPDDLQIVREGPSIRRRFINLEASRLSPKYFKELRAYQRVLLQRNHLLKDKQNRRQINVLLEPWDQSLIALGSNIIRYRIEVISDLEKEAQLFFSLMTNSQETLSLNYLSTVNYCDDLPEIPKNFHSALMTKRDQEFNRGSTAIGPHLDDFKILINGYDARRFSSQGQKRTAALALKMAEVHLFKRQNHEWPIILLDDVFSEFDTDRKKHLLDFLRDNTGQCFISTAVGLNNLVESLNREHKIFSVRQGCASDEIVRSSS